MDYDVSKINAIKDLLVKRKYTLAVAESVTSGHLQMAFSVAEKASEFFQGGITAYNVGQKTRHLAIEPIHALANNCVSESIAERMALQVGNMFLSDYNIGVTGYATPMPGIDRLFAYVSITLNNKVVFAGKLYPEKSNLEGYEVQVSYTNQILEVLFQLLMKPA